MLFVKEIMFSFEGSNQFLHLYNEHQNSTRQRQYSGWQ
jgi:hypothetical protein